MSTPTATKYRTYTDGDTRERGRSAPFAFHESDHTSLVHVLWALKNDAVIALKPGRNLPLRAALWARLHGRDQRFSDGLINDLREILDAHDPEITPGAVGAQRLDYDQVQALPVEDDLRDPAASDSIAANVITRSRWMAAHTAFAQRQALLDAAQAEEDAGCGESAQRLRERADALVSG